MATQQQAKRTVEEIYEQEMSADQINGIALMICEIKNDCEVFADEWKDDSVRDYYEIPKEFVDLCRRVADFEVRL